MAIQAIETEYNGVRFRSRTEARWALFFDALGVRWEYEPEAFALPSGNYLPDFRLHVQHSLRGCENNLFLYAEVKPEPGMNEREGRIGFEFVESGHHALLILNGAPDKRFPLPALFDVMWYGDGEHLACEDVCIFFCDETKGLIAVDRHGTVSMCGCKGGAADKTAQLHMQALATVRAHRFWNPK